VRRGCCAVLGFEAPARTSLSTPIISLAVRPSLPFSHDTKKPRMLCGTAALEFLPVVVCVARPSHTHDARFSPQLLATLNRIHEHVAFRTCRYCRLRRKVNGDIITISSCVGTPMQAQVQECTEHGQSFSE
jgi:hypothetical protein